MLFVCLAVVLPSTLPAQVSTSTTPVPAAAKTDAVDSAAASISGSEGPAAGATYVKGFNASLVTSSQHDSASAWSNTLAPDVSFAYNSHLGMDFSFPYYTYLDTYVAGGSILKPTNNLITVHNMIGDASSSVHLAFSPWSMDYVLTVTGGFPVGNTTYGLSATEYTYNVNNHFDKAFGIFTPDIELGIGDSTNLLKRRAAKSNIIIGPLANFTAGVSMDLPFNMSFSTDAYENLPLENQSTYRTIRNTKKRTKTVVQTGSGPAEDNGFETNLDIPLNPHVVLSGFYNRSLRQREDTAGFSLTFLLRAPKPAAAAAPKASTPAPAAH
jgi:hypothetical protein